MDQVNSSNISSTCMTPVVQGTALIVINSLLVPIGTFGNLLIIFAIWNTPQLYRRVSNYLLLSLAVADMLVTLCVQPILVAWLSFSTFLHQCVPEIDQTYDISVNISCGSSLFHLTFIGIDRAISILNPHRYRDIVTKRRIKAVIAICWVVSVVIVCFRVRFYIESALFGICIFFGGYLLFIASYGAIIYKVMQTSGRRNTGSTGIEARKSSSARDKIMEKKVCEAVGIVTLIFSFCWLPFFIYIILTKGNHNNNVAYFWIRTLYLSNSSVNFIVYSWRIDQFRVAYKKIINSILQRFGIVAFRRVSGLTESVAASNSQPVADNVFITNKEEEKEDGIKVVENKDTEM